MLRIFLHFVRLHDMHRRRLRRTPALAKVESTWSARFVIARGLFIEQSTTISNTLAALFDTAHTEHQRLPAVVSGTSRRSIVRTVLVVS